VRNFLNLHSREQKGVTLLVLICVGLMTINLYLGQIYESPPIKVTVVEDTILDVKSTSLLFNFYPNTISKDSLLLLGVSDVLAKQWVNYREKVRPFQSEDDLKKLYAMNDSLLEQLKPYMQWAENKKSNFQVRKSNVEQRINEHYASNSKEKSFSKIEINNASLEQLKSIKGIGSVYATRIVKFKELLGGYVHKSQLKEVYGINDSLYSVIENQVLIDSIKIKRIDVNNAEAKTLAKHPYINWSVAQSVVNYRQMHGCYQQLSDIMRSDLVNAILYNKIAPYLKADSCLSQPD
jgi:competence protein ComEA